MSVEAKSEQAEQGGARAYAFLFDASVDGVSDPALQFFSAAVLAALSNADPDGTTRSQFRNGLTSLSDFATRTTAVHAREGSTGRTVSYDMDTYKYVIWDWLDSLSEGWSSVDPEKGEAIFRRRTEECVTLTDLADDIRDEVDRRLHDTTGYVGAFAIDLGNPVHRRGFLDLLSHSAAICDGTVFQDRTFEGDEDWGVEGATEFKPGGLVWKPYGWLALEGPEKPGKTPLSPRGERAQAALEGKHGSTVEGRVIEAIDDAFRFHSPRQAFDFQAVGAEGDILEAIMPEGKFTDYLFNREHEEGGPKAAFFIDFLGIEPDDWRYLAAQFYQGLLIARPENLFLQDWGSGYGMRFNVHMRVRGRSGVQAIVRTGWMLKPGSLPSLASAPPGDRDADAVDPGEQPILPPGPRTDESWATLWGWASAAGIRALEAVVPTPMYLVGYPPISEGEMGSATFEYAMLDEEWPAGSLVAASVKATVTAGPSFSTRIPEPRWSERSHGLALSRSCSNSMASRRRSRSLRASSLRRYAPARNVGNGRKPRKTRRSAIGHKRPFRGRHGGPRAGLGGGSAGLE